MHQSRMNVHQEPVLFGKTMSQTVRVKYNGEGSGDWVEISVNGDVVYEGHNIAPCRLPDVLDAIMGYDKIWYESVGDDTFN